MHTNGALEILKNSGENSHELIVDIWPSTVHFVFFNRNNKNAKKSNKINSISFLLWKLSVYLCILYKL